MRVVTLNLRKHDYLRLACTGYFLYHTDSGHHLLLEDRCRHRGAPLSLGSREAGGVLRCPWHGMRYTEELLGRLAQPFVRRGEQCAAVLPESNAPSVGLFCFKRLLLANTLATRTREAALLKAQ